MRFVTVLILIMTLWHSAYAAPPTLTDYRDRALELELGFYGAATLRRAGDELDFGHFGGGAGEILAGSPEALEAAGAYRGMRIAGFTVTLVGGAVLLAELVLILTGSEAVVDESATGSEGLKPLTFALLGTGLGLSVVGIGLEFGSVGYLTDAVNHYNRDLARGTLSPSAGLRLNGSF